MNWIFHISYFLGNIYQVYFLRRLHLDLPLDPLEDFQLLELFTIDMFLLSCFNVQHVGRFGHLYKFLVNFLDLSYGIFSALQQRLLPFYNGYYFLTFQ